jgi:hypothetical protein
MQTLLLDTNSVIKKLEQRGFSRAQAEGITDALKELDAASLVTKTDLERALARTTTTIITWMTGALLAQGRLSSPSSSTSNSAELSAASSMGSLAAVMNRQGR